MLGNTRGWMIAVIVAGLQALLVWQAIVFNQPTPVTAMASDPAVLRPVALSIDPVTLVPMDQPGDAASLYRDAIAEVQRQTDRYEKLTEDGTTGTPRSIADFPAVQKLIDATSLAPSPILATNLNENVVFAFEPDDLKALALAGKAAEQMGVLNMADHLEIADQCFRAEIALGAKMLAERLRYYEAFDGIAMLRGGAGGLKAMAGRANKADEVATLTKFDAAAGEQLNRLTKVWNVVGSVDTNQIAVHSGDVLFFAGPAMQERMWRLESTLKLGRYKYNAGKQADVSAAERQLKLIIATEKDPALLAAANAADRMSFGDFHTLQTGR